MANIIDYARQRSGVPLERSGLGEVDALILSQLSYLPLDGIVPESFGESVSLADAARALLACDTCERLMSQSGEQDRRLLAALAQSARFGGMRLTGFVDLHDESAQEQFAAVTFLYGDGAFIAFRGTDGTLVGWKEDFNMSFEREVPAQRSAVRYVQQAARALGSRPLTLAGHSKGGNLAAYAALFADEDTRARVRMAYNFDGPGFNEGVAAARAAAEPARIRTLVPQGSVVGMLLWHSEPFWVVQSDGNGLLQHDPYTWQVMGGRFVPADGRSLGSRFADATLKDWLLRLPRQTRRKAIDGIYEVIRSSQDRNVSDLLDAQSLFSALHKTVALDADTRRAIEQMLALLAVSAAEAVPGMAIDAANSLLK